MNSLTHHQRIYEGLQGWNLPLSKPILRHLLHAVDGMKSIRFSGELTAIHAASHHPKHLTTLGHFFNIAHGRIFSSALNEATDPPETSEKRASSCLGALH